jgi:hypothetical protein
MRAAGISVVRWFLFCDGRSGIRYESGIPAGVDDYLYKDVETALGIATQLGMRVCFSLFDFAWLQTPVSAVSNAEFPGRVALQFAGGREALLHRVLIPLFRKFRAHPGLFAWEVVNEPEWAIHEFQPFPSASLSLANGRSFFAEVAQAIREEANVPATLGCARLQWVRTWSEIGLDYLQAHYYPEQERDQKLSLQQQLAALAPFAPQLFVGELPANDPATPGYSLVSALNTCRDAGIAGVGIWRWRPPEPGGDDVAFGCVELGTLAGWNAQPDSIDV